MWYLIPLILALVIVFLLFLKIRVCLSYEDEFVVKVKVLFLNFSVIPRKQKKIKPKNYSLKKLQKRQDKLKKKNQKKELKKQKHVSEHQKDKADKIKDILELIKIVLDNVLSPFGKYLKIEILKLYIKIATNDPSRTAIVYGAVSQTASYIIEGLSNITNVDVKKKESINIFADFLSEKSEAAINITLGLRVWHLFSISFKFAFAFLKKNLNKQKEQSK